MAIAPHDALQSQSQSQTGPRPKTTPATTQASKSRRSSMSVVQEKRPRNSLCCGVESACQRANWSGGESSHPTKLSRTALWGGPCPIRGPCFQVAVTYGLPCPAVRDSRAWERRCIYCLIMGRLTPYCAASRAGNEHTGTPAARVLNGLAGVGLYALPGR